MFPKNERLTKKRDIERVYRKGRHAASGFIYLNALENKYYSSNEMRSSHPTGSNNNSKVNRINSFRVTVVVGTKTGLKAAGRNLFKRRVRAYLIQNKSELPQNHDVIVGIKGKFPKVPKYTEVANHLGQCLKKLRSAPSGFTKKPYRRTTDR